jgi:hypothetical protein
MPRPAAESVLVDRLLELGSDLDPLEPAAGLVAAIHETLHPTDKTASELAREVVGEAYERGELLSALLPGWRRSGAR